MGDARIGVAVSDPTGLIATPGQAIVRSDIASDIGAILATAQAADAVRIIVGLPLTLEGRAGAQARSVKEFCRALRAKTDLPVETYDERLSTVEATRGLRAAGVKASRDRGRLDSASAAVILQSYLESRSMRGTDK